jgi:hypothetical protein
MQYFGNVVDATYKYEISIEFRVLDLTAEHASHVGNALGVVRLPLSLVVLDLRRLYRAPLCRVSASHLLCLWTTAPSARALSLSFSSTIGFSTCLKSSSLKRGLLRGGICGWRFAIFGREFLEIDIWGCGLIKLHGSIPTPCC